MLTTETFTLEEGRTELTDAIDAIDEALDELDETTDEAAALRSRRGTLTYWRNGIGWHLENTDWTPDTEITIGATDAGEDAMRDRKMPDQAGEKEISIWCVAASAYFVDYEDDVDDSIDKTPFVEDSLEETFANVSSFHRGVVMWLEAKANELGLPSESGNRSSKSSPATDSEATSTPAPNSTT